MPQASPNNIDMSGFGVAQQPGMYNGGVPNGMPNGNGMPPPQMGM